MKLIPSILISCIVLSLLVWGLVGAVLQPDGLVPYTGFLVVVVTGVFMIWVWDRISLASINLWTALGSLRAVFGDVVLSTGALLAASYLWSLLWSIAYLGIVDLIDYHQYKPVVYIPTYLLFGISFLWTNVVIKVSKNGASRSQHGDGDSRRHRFHFRIFCKPPWPQL